MEIFDIVDLISRADAGDNNAINKIHNYYCLEKYINQSYEPEQIQIIKKMASENNPYSLIHLSIMYLYGFGLEKNFDKGIKLLKKSINVGCSEAYYLMGILVLTDKTKYELGYNKLLDKAIKLNNSSALMQRGTEYSGTDPKKSSEFYKKAILLGNNYAVYKLGELYHDNRNYKLAIKYYKLAMIKNVHHAYFNLAVMYREGEGMQKNFIFAKELFEKADELGNTRAMTCIGVMYHDQGNLEGAKRYHKLAISKYDDTLSKYNLGLIYKEMGNHKKAIKLFIEAAKTDHKTSKNRLLNWYGLSDLNATDDEIDELLKFHTIIKKFGCYDGIL